MVKWARNIRVKTSCEMDIVNFPYDVQSCPITISSQDNSNEFLKLSTRKWNRINNVDENEIDVRPSDIDTVKVNFQTLCCLYDATHAIFFTGCLAELILF